MMNNRVLFVDDESNVLDGIRRTLRRGFSITTAVGPHEGLNALRTANEPFAVVVSDMRMPEIDGVEFLEQAKTITPTTIRVMLTGNADQETAVRAVNSGEIFKFLNKPCDHVLLEQVVSQGIQQYHLHEMERDLLDNTLKGSLTVLAEILALANPLAFGRVKRIRNLCSAVAEALGLKVGWEFDSAIMLSQMGCVSLPEAILEKMSSGVRLQGKELDAFQQHPQVAANLLRRIPRMEGVADVISYQLKNFDGSGVPQIGPNGEGIPLHARILRVVLEFDHCNSAGNTVEQSLAYLRMRSNQFDPAVLDALEHALKSAEAVDIVALPVERLEVGMVVEEDIKSDKNVLLACRGLELTPVSLGHLLNFKKNGSLSKLVKVRSTPSKTNDPA